MKRTRQTLHLRPVLASSLHLFRARPFAHVALGAAILLSLVSVFCLLGVATTPFFVAELFLMQLAVLRESRPLGSPRRVPALLLLAQAVLLIASVVTVGALSGSPRVDSWGVMTPSLVDALLSTGGAYGLLSGLLAMLFVLPFVYAPLCLLEGRPGMVAALVRSACLVGEGGYMRHLGLSLISHLVQLAPVLVALLLVAARGGAELAPVLLVSLPLMALTIPLGQGMFVASYHAQAATFDGPACGAVAARRLHPRTESRRELRRVSTVIWTLVLSSPLVTSLLLFASVLSPSVLREGVSQGAPLKQVAPLGQEAVPMYPPATALTVWVRRDGVQVVASDGGGTGTLPLARKTPVSLVRLTRWGQAFGIEVQQGARVSHTLVDPAGVRLDDSWTDRLLARASLSRLITVYLCLWLIGLVAGPILTHLARDGLHPRSAQQDATDFHRAQMRALWAGVALSLPALWALQFAVVALLNAA